MLPHLHDAKDKIDKVGEEPIGFSPTFFSVAIHRYYYMYGYVFM